MTFDLDLEWPTEHIESVPKTSNQAVPPQSRRHKTMPRDLPLARATTQGPLEATVRTTTLWYHQRNHKNSLEVTSQTTNKTLILALCHLQRVLNFSVLADNNPSWLLRWNLLSMPIAASKPCVPKKNALKCTLSNNIVRVHIKVT